MTDRCDDDIPAVTRIVRRVLADHVAEMHLPRPIPSWLYPPRTPLGDGDQVLSPSAEELRTMALALDACEGTPLMVRIVHRDGSPWVEFDVATGPERPPQSLDEATRLAILSRPSAYRVERFALWRYTLDVYRLDESGAVEDDPINLARRNDDE
jgi:hypothetical protein